MESPKVSVSLITYNHAPFIAQAIESVLTQKTDFPFELIIGEDDSKDGTREIVTRYADQYPDQIRTHLHSRSSNITYQGRPTGRHNFVNNLRSAQGQYIALLDGDDFWTDPEKLQRQVDFLDSHPECTTCFHRVRVVDERENELEKSPSYGHDGAVFTLSDLLRRRFFTRAPSVMFRRGMFDDFPEWYYRCPVGDFPLHVLNGLKGDYGFLDREMGAYRMHGGGVWSANPTAVTAGPVDPRKLRQMNSIAHLYEILAEALSPRYQQELREGIGFYSYQAAHLSRQAHDWPALRTSLGKMWDSRPFPKEVSILSVMALLAQAWFPPVATVVGLVRKFTGRHRTG